MMVKKKHVGFIDYCTFRKPTNTYAYLPYVSNHGQSTFNAIVYTELHRLLRTNRNADSFDREVSFFRNKFLNVGHSPAAFDYIAGKFCFSRKSELLAAKTGKVRSAIVPLKLCFFPGLAQLKLGSILSKHLNIIDSSISGLIRPVLCCTTSANLFRIRYNRFL